MAVAARAGFVLAAAWVSVALAGDPPTSWLAEAERRVADAEYEITWQTTTALADLDAAWQAPNRAHDLRTYFTDKGIRVVPRTGGSTPAWEWGLVLARTGRRTDSSAAEQASVRVDRHRIDYDRGAVTEWYVNDSTGLEQGFKFRKPPSGERGDVVIDLALSGTLSPALSEDGRAVDFRTPGGSPVLHYADLKVTDALGHALDSRMEALVRGIRLVFDDRDAAYPVTVDPLTTSYTWSASGHQDTAWFGRSVATAGDVNGDGFSDVVVGAPFFDNGQNDEGRAFVYLGSASGLQTSAAWTAEGDQADANFGWSVAPAGDVNGDGFADLIVGAPQYGNGQFQEGRAFLYLGSASGLQPSAAWTAESDQANARLGTSVATAGDVNGDGYADVIVSAPDYGGSVGRVLVYLGSSTGLGTTPAWTKDGAQDIEFGNAVATAGDVNGDGYADVIVGAELQDTDQSGEGRAYVYLGSSSGLASTPTWTVEGDSVAAHLGHSVSTAGDVNGDDYADVIVGADSFSNGESAEGRALVYLGSGTGLSTTPAWAVESNSAAARFGSSVATAGDVNGDGYADVVVGSPRSDGLPGRVEVYLGSAAGLSTTSIFGVFSTPGQAGDRFGWSVATAGDVNGDGYSDLIAGAYQYSDELSHSGGAFVYLGSASNLALTPAWTAADDQQNGYFGSSVASAGDVNGDGYSDVLIGARYYDDGDFDEGAAFLFLGSAAGLSSNWAWYAQSNFAGASFGCSVASAGDVNGDGYSDVLVGALRYGPAETGRVFLYLGSPAGLSQTPAWTVDGDQSQAYFGISVATAGDVNGDGYSDALVGAQRYDDGEQDEGRAYLYLGSAAGLATTPAWTAESNQADAYFGDPVSTAGDVNGDGYSDVVVGAPDYSNGQAGEGRAYLYLGSASGLATAAAWTAEGDQTGVQFGGYVATAGDVNGDGYSDVAIGAPFYSNGETQEGRAYVYLGSASGLTTIPWTAESNKAGADFGYPVTTAGDVNGDGYSDIVVGAEFYDHNQGRVFLYLGSALGLASTPAWTADGDPAAFHFGSSLAAAGDVNGDGYADVIVGTPYYYTGQYFEGRAYVYYGGGGDGLDQVPRQARADGTAPVALLGKSDSETGFRLEARGRTAAGRGAVRLRWEARPLGNPLATYTATSPARLTGVPGASGSWTSFDEPVTGLGEGTFYRWRSRIVSANPFFPRSPWKSLAGNNVTETKLRTSGCVDRDGDGYGDLGDPSCLSLVPDCDDRNASAWGTPGEIVNLRFTSKTTLAWDPPASPGAPVSSLIYATVRSGIASSFPAGDCVESHYGPGTTAVDPATPSRGQALFYLIRAQDLCPQAVGTLGAGSSGVPRVGPSCPTPPVADAGGPYTCAAHQTIQLDGTGSHATTPGGSITFAWDLDNDGVFGDSTLVSPVFSCPNVIGTESTLCLRVTTFGLTDTNCTTATVH